MTIDLCVYKKRDFDLNVQETLGSERNFFRKFIESSFIKATNPENPLSSCIKPQFGGQNLHFSKFQDIPTFLS